MSHWRKRKRRRKVIEKITKRLSMEEKSPTMLGVVFLKYVKITRKGEDSQGKFELFRV